MNKPKMTVYVADSNFVSNEVLSKITAMEGFKHSQQETMHEFLIHVVGISYREQIEDSHIDFQCMLDHIWDLEIEQLTHEEIRTLDIEADVYHVHTFPYYAPNSLIHVRYIELAE